MSFPKGTSPFFSVLALSFTLFGCGAADPFNVEDDNLSVDQEYLSYSLHEVVNGTPCNYKSPVYDTIDEYCTALQDSSLNRDPVTDADCAESTRREYFIEYCDGDFTPTP